MIIMNNNYEMNNNISLKLTNKSDDNLQEYIPSLNFMIINILNKKLDKMLN
jgi:hypothetical protein